MEHKTTILLYVCGGDKNRELTQREKVNTRYLGTQLADKDLLVDLVLFPPMPVPRSIAEFMIGGFENKMIDRDPLFHGIGTVVKQEESRLASDDVEGLVKFLTEVGMAATTITTICITHTNRGMMEIVHELFRQHGTEFFHEISFANYQPGDFVKIVFDGDTLKKAHALFLEDPYGII
ncbi:MAG: hypothetical protein AAB963_01635 [Patescibacteria group bacterium]